MLEQGSAQTCARAARDGRKGQAQRRLLFRRSPRSLPLALASFPLIALLPHPHRPVPAVTLLCIWDGCCVFCSSSPPRSSGDASEPPKFVCPFLCSALGKFQIQIFSFTKLSNQRDYLLYSCISTVLWFENFDLQVVKEKINSLEINLCSRGKLPRYPLK